MCVKGRGLGFKKGSHIYIYTQSGQWSYCVIRKMHWWLCAPYKCALTGSHAYLLTCYTCRIPALSHPVSLPPDSDITAWFIKRSDNRVRLLNVLSPAHTFWHTAPVWSFHCHIVSPPPDSDVIATFIKRINKRVCALWMLPQLELNLIHIKKQLTPGTCDLQNNLNLFHLSDYFTVLLCFSFTWQ